MTETDTFSAGVNASGRYVDLGPVATFATYAKMSDAVIAAHPDAQPIGTDIFGERTFYVGRGLVAHGWRLKARQWQVRIVTRDEFPNMLPAYRHDTWGEVQRAVAKAHPEVDPPQEYADGRWHFHVGRGLVAAAIRKDGYWNVRMHPPQQPQLSDPRYVSEVIGPRRYCVGLLGSECSEVSKLCHEGMRFGVDTPYKPDASLIEEITRECGDVLASIEFAIAHDLLDGESVRRAKIDKLRVLLDPKRVDNLGRRLAPALPDGAVRALLANKFVNL